MADQDAAAKEPERQAGGSRRVVEGVNLAVYTLIGLALVASANYFANRYTRRWDLTPTKKYSLSPQTLKMLKGLSRDVTVYIFDRKEGLREGRDLVENYSKASTRLKVRYVDPDREPSLARQFAVRSYGTVVVAAGDRHFEAQGATEEGISNGLIRLLKGQKTVYFVQGHGERDLDSSERTGYSKIKKQFEDENYVVKTLVLLQKMEIPSDCSILVIAGPHNDYLPQETDTIRKYVVEGGRLMVMLDAGEEVPNLAKLLAEWNVNDQHDLVIDMNPVAQLFGTRPEMPLIIKYGSSPIVQPLARTATLFPITRSFAIGKDSKTGVTVDSLCETSAESFGVADFNPKMHEISFRAGKDYKGPLSVAVSGTMTREGEKKSEGRFVALGTSAFVSNVYLLPQFGNRDLFMNMVNWLSQEEELISIRPKPPESQHLTMTVRQMDRAFYLGVVGLPLAIVLIGASVWWRRR
jgi:ABC-type uncharacterized transport system involved in gliding motility auxiliary subunit